MPAAVSHNSVSMNLVYELIFLVIPKSKSCIEISHQDAFMPDRDMKLKSHFLARSHCSTYS